MAPNTGEEAYVLLSNYPGDYMTMKLAQPQSKLRGFQVGYTGCGVLVPLLLQNVITLTKSKLVHNNMFLVYSVKLIVMILIYRLTQQQD